jgi:hypothetical protein
MVNKPDTARMNDWQLLQRELEHSRAEASDEPGGLPVLIAEALRDTADDISRVLVPDLVRPCKP